MDMNSFDHGQLILGLTVLGIGSVLCVAPMLAYFFIHRKSSK